MSSNSVSGQPLAQPLAQPKKSFLKTHKKKAIAVVIAALIGGAAAVDHSQFAGKYRDITGNAFKDLGSFLQKAFTENPAEATAIAVASLAALVIIGLIIKKACCSKKTKELEIEPADQSKGMVKGAARGVVADESADESADGAARGLIDNDDQDLDNN
ncbi:hypothetical protein SCG7109_AX_00130 [Chlamydiales bacterium SCGC AG-110-M15]|nr:hypothetical protein SCG7109_AX_00130 [Chlamydiales bacterium SCGC AG-110-M15]